MKSQPECFSKKETQNEDYEETGQGLRIAQGKRRIPDPSKNKDEGAFRRISKSADHFEETEKTTKRKTGNL